MALTISPMASPRLCNPTISTLKSSPAGSANPRLGSNGGCRSIAAKPSPSCSITITSDGAHDGTRTSIRAAPGADDARSAQGRGQAPAAPRCANVRRAAGLAVIERDGHWHIHGRLRIKGHVKRIRESTGLPATAANREAAEELRRQREGETRDAIIWGVRPSVPFEIAADQYLSRPRERPLNAIDIARLQELERRFRGRRLNRIEQAEWSGFVDARMKGRAPVTRERYIDTILAFLAWCQRRPRVWLGELPIFERDQKARQRTERRARRVGELRPDLIALLVASAPPHLRGQVAIMWSTGARVSSIIYGCRLCDYLAAEGREQITFHDTKNGDRVTATVHPWAAGVCATISPGAASSRTAKRPCF